MKSIRSVIDFELTWTQPSAFKSVFELRFGGELVATLRFPKMVGSAAVVESGDGSWTFRRIGFWKTKTVITAIDSPDELGSYVSNPWKGGGVLELADGRKFIAQISVWKRTFEFRAKTGEPLFHIRNQGVFRLSASVRINRNAVQVPELPWLVPFAFYLGALARRDSSATAATAAATG